MENLAIHAICLGHLGRIKIKVFEADCEARKLITTRRKWHVFCAVLRSSFYKSLKFLETSIASLDPESVQLPAFSILSAMFTGACGPPEKLSLALVPRSCVLRMIVSLAYFTVKK